MDPFPIGVTAGKHKRSSLIGNPFISEFTACQNCSLLGEITPISQGDIVGLTQVSLIALIMGLLLYLPGHRK